MRSFFGLAVLAVSILGWFFCSTPKKESGVVSLPVPPTSHTNEFYTSNRPPLVPNPLIKLPVGSIEPGGWLRRQLQLMREGFTGHLSEISPYLKRTNGWVKSSNPGWEEMPYWLKGFTELGFLLRDEILRNEAEFWIEAVMKNRDEDGYFGPAENKKNHDLWPNMIVLQILRNRYEAKPDGRILEFMKRYFEYQHRLPEDSLLPASWQKYRGGENAESVYWLYNRTGEPFLLDLAAKLRRLTHDWKSPILTPQRDRQREISGFYHGVNISMGIRYPGIFFQQSKDRSDLEAVETNYRAIMDAYGQQPGGMFNADENIRPGKDDPCQGAETCSMVELMNSHESMLAITGDIRYADRCEEIAFNSLPASMTPDLKGLHYLTAPNLIACDSSGLHDFANSGTLVSFDPWSYRCCQHNVAFGWPYFTEHLWFATPDQGLAAVLFAPCRVKARVSGGVEVSIEENTQYPFGDTIAFQIHTDRPVGFPLYLRIPEWCQKPVLLVNDIPVTTRLKPGRYAVLTREWNPQDRVVLVLGMDIDLHSWSRFPNTVSIRRGPLWYSLQIGETWKRYGGTDQWPSYEILSNTPWNYALEINRRKPDIDVLLHPPADASEQPFSVVTAPVTLKISARRILDWKEEGRMVGEIPEGRVKSDQPLERISLIPMGCARLRITVFPLIPESSP